MHGWVPFVVQFRIVLQPEFVAGPGAGPKSGPWGVVGRGEGGDLQARTHRWMPSHAATGLTRRHTQSDVSPAATLHPTVCAPLWYSKCPCGATNAPVV